jgi:hypothetical protein
MAFKRSRVETFLGPLPALAVGLLALSQRYSTIKEKEVCQLRPEKK